MFLEQDAQSQALMPSANMPNPGYLQLFVPPCTTSPQAQSEKQAFNHKTRQQSRVNGLGFFSATHTARTPSKRQVENTVREDCVLVQQRHEQTNANKIKQDTDS